MPQAICETLDKGKDMVRLFVRYGCDINSVISYSRPLNLAATYQDDDMVLFLVNEMHAEINPAPERNTETPLTCVVKKYLITYEGQKNFLLERIKLLISLGAHTDWADGNGETPLALAQKDERLRTLFSV
jgi:ankyrin repeat protein